MQTLLAAGTTHHRTPLLAHCWLQTQHTTDTPASTLLAADVARVADLQGVEEQLSQRAHQEDLRQLAEHQASLAQSVGHVAAWVATRPEKGTQDKGIPAGATKFRWVLEPPS